MQLERPVCPASNRYDLDLIPFWFQCYIYSWYLAVDMQLYFIAPAVIYSIYRFKSKAILVLIVLILVCIGSTLDVHVKYGLKTL